MRTIYDHQLDTLAELFGGSVDIRGGQLVTPRGIYPIVDDVIVLLSPEEYPASLAARLGIESRHLRIPAIEGLVQYSFGDEWRQYSQVLPEHSAEFASYFDLIDLSELREARVCDLGCGIGRWSYYLAPHCRELILVDFSEAVFLARRNLSGLDRVLFFMADIRKLPFMSDFADFAFCLGVLHHLRTPALQAVSSIAHSAPVLLIYLYYALDNRPWYFHVLLRFVSASRRVLSRVRSPRARHAIAVSVAALVYRPLISVGYALDRWGWGGNVPLFEVYRRKSLYRIQQDVYDRMFTPVEQRVTRREIVENLRDRFGSITVSERPPYWHFLCRR